LPSLQWRPVNKLKFRKMKEKLAEYFYGPIYFGEGPRWNNGHLYFSDFYANSVFKISEDKKIETVLTLDDQPSGIGWLTNGDMLVVAMKERKIMRYQKSGIDIYADISNYATFLANDMVVGPSDYLWVGNFGFDLDSFIEEKGLNALVSPPGPPKAHLIRVGPDRQAAIGAENLDFPNGCAITPDNKTLIVAETLGLRLTAFDIDSEFNLVNKRTWADLRDHLCVPDGICLDESGCVWVANAIGNECIRVEEGGNVIEKVKSDLPCFACMLGGENGDTLFIMSAPTSIAKLAKENKSGKILSAKVDSKRAGWP
jgi:sugar lactone lactonase YvrE